MRNSSIEESTGSEMSNGSDNGSELRQLPFHQSCEEKLKNIEKRRHQREKEELNIGWYFWLLTNYPSIVISLCLIVTMVIGVVNVIYTTPPDFSKPAKGLEVRGTELATKLISWRKLIEFTEGYCSSKTLSTVPCQRAQSSTEKVVRLPQQQQQRRKQSKKKQRRNSRKGRRRNGNRRSSRQLRQQQNSGVNRTRMAVTMTTTTPQSSVNTTLVINTTSILRYYDVIHDNGGEWNFTEEYFCQDPKPEHARWVFESRDDDVTLWSMTSLHSMCELQRRLLEHPTYPGMCNRGAGNKCCPTVSLPNFVARLSNRSTCDDVTTSDMTYVEKLVSECAPYYCNGQLQRRCWDGRSDAIECDVTIPRNCTDHNSMFTLFHYVMDTSSVCGGGGWSSDMTSLRRTMVFIPVRPQHDQHFVPLYLDNFVTSSQLREGDVVVRAMDFNIEGYVFAHQLTNDVIFPAIAGVVVMMMIAMYTGSIFITLMSFMSTGAAMSLAYFLYKILLGLRFFPFLNLTAILVMMGLSADNVILYHNIWNTTSSDDAITPPDAVPVRLRRQPPRHRLGVVAKTTWHHASKSLGVTGITTGVAFFANVTSQVTAVKCFAIYTGLAVLCNLLFALTLLPASVVFHHKHFSFSYLPPTDSKMSTLLPIRLLTTIRHQADKLANIFFNHIQLLLVVRFRWIGIITCLCVTSIACYVIFGSPGVRLPVGGNAFQYFSSDHPFEQYRDVTHEHFRFANQSRDVTLPIRVIFGLHAIDEGDHRDPDDVGHLKRVMGTNITSRVSQRWLRGFCRIVRSSKYARDVMVDDVDDDGGGNPLSSCQLEKFAKWTQRPCIYEGDKCCGMHEFPMPPHLFDQCVKEAVRRIDLVNGVNRYSPGPRFDNKNIIRILILEFPSNVSVNADYVTMKDFYTTMNDVIGKELSRAPQGLKDGWFVSDLDIYSLQDGLLRGTMTSLGLSLVVALVVVMVTTLNVVVTSLACMTIASIIVVVGGMMCMLGWELNVLESITISISVGLSVDFTAHLAIGYLLAPHKHDRQRRVEHASTRLSSAISLAAITTFMAGLGLMTSRVLAYERFGAFLMMVMAISWIYSIFFFLGMLSVGGPQDERCSIDAWTCLCCCCCRYDDVTGGTSSSVMKTTVTGDTEHTTTMLTDTSSMTRHHHPPPQLEIIERSTLI